MARKLGVSRSWLYEAAKAGLIPSIRLCGGEGPLRFVPEDVDDWIAEARKRWILGRSAPPASAVDVAQRFGVRERRGS